MTETQKQKTRDFYAMQVRAHESTTSGSVWVIRCAKTNHYYIPSGVTVEISGAQLYSWEEGAKKRARKLNKEEHFGSKWWTPVEVSLSIKG